MYVLYMVMSQDQNAERNQIDKSSFERVEEFKYLGTILTNHNFVQEDIKSRLKSGQVQNILSSSLLSKNLKIKIYKIIFLSAVTYGHETWSLTLREERRLRLFKSSVLRGILGAEREEVTGEWRKLHNEDLNDLYCLPNNFQMIKLGRMK